VSLCFVFDVESSAICLDDETDRASRSEIVSLYLITAVSSDDGPLRVSERSSSAKCAGVCLRQLAMSREEVLLETKMIGEATVESVIRGGRGYNPILETAV